MEEQAINDLLQYLSEKGFHGKELEDVLRSRIKSDLPEFSIDHRISFNHQKELIVSYRLNFKKNYQVNAYLFDCYQASCIISPEVKNEQYGDINSLELDRQMFNVNWGLYFSGGATAGVNNGMAQQCITKINKLLQSNEDEKIDVARTLMFKYWPKEQLGTDWAGNYEGKFQRKRDYTNELHANLAYHIMSGELDMLYEKIRCTGMDMVSGFDLYTTLCDLLKSNPESFLLQTDFLQQEGRGTVQLSVVNTGNTFEIERLCISLTWHPTIEHKEINGIDTAALERDMAAVHWSNDHELFIFKEDDIPDFKPKVEAIFKQMSSFKDDPGGQKIYDLLSLKYWSGSTFFEGFIREQAWELSESLPKTAMDFPSDMDITIGINLLAGRPVMAHLVDKSRRASNLWVRLDYNKPADDRYFYFGGTTMDELGELIFCLPLVPNLERRIITDLISGERVKAKLKNGLPILIEADPLNKTLKIFSVDGRPIQVNLKFDPNWQPQSQVPEHCKKTRAPNTKISMNRKSDTGRNSRP